VPATVGTVKTLSRFPVKSLLGESPASVDIANTGIVGDRAWGLVDVETGKVASAKHPRIWAALLGLRATYPDGVGTGRTVRIDLGDGSVVDSTDADVDARVSAAVGRDVYLTAEVPAGASYDEEWPDVEGMAPAEFVAGTRSGRSAGGNDISALPVGMLAPGTFQDVAPLTLLTTASLRAAENLHPAGDWDERRFRSTILVDVQDGEGFVEQAWVGQSLRIGEVELSVTAPTPRCVMVTLGQQDLPDDSDVLRTLAKHNRVDVLGTGLFACLGVYASVVRGGRIHNGDKAELA
jgi:uncharacterized protein YcbX